MTYKIFHDQSLRKKVAGLGREWIFGQLQEQPVQTQIKLLLLEQFDLGIHCLSFSQHILDKLSGSLIFLFQIIG